MATSVTRIGFVVWIGIAGCFDLPDVPRGTCGNGVLDPGEDCDSFADPALGSGLVCTASCRYACTPGPDPGCPIGWGCGIDQVCRHGDGTFAVTGPVMMAAATLGAVALDGDGTISAIGANGGTLDVLRGTDGLSTTLLRVGGLSLFTAQDLTGDGHSSLLTSGGTSIIGWRATADHGFQSMLAISNVPASYATAEGVRFVPMRTAVSTDHDVSFVLLQPTSDQLLLTTQFALETEATPAVYTIPQITGALTELVPPAIGNVDGAPGDELALGFAGSDQIAILSTNASPTTGCVALGTCWAAVGGTGEIEAPTVIKVLSLATLGRVLGDPPGTASPRSLVFADVDNDGSEDLVIPVDSGEVVVANGDGAGNFTFGPLTTPETKIFSDAGVRLPCTASMASSTVSYAPLLAGDFDGDGRTDYVDEEGIILGRPGVTYCRASATVTATAAVALDANGDGRTDIAVIDGGFVILETQGPLPGEFDAHPIAIPDGAIATGLETAEVDGDYLGDVVIHAVGIDHAAELWIAHGTTNLTQVALTPGPDVSSAQTSVAGTFQGQSGSTGGLVVYGHDLEADTDYTAALGATPGGLASELQFEVAGSLSTAFEVQLGRFLPGGAAGTFDLLVLHSGTKSKLAVDVWPSQGEVLREFGHLMGSVGPIPALNRDGIRVYGDLDGDGIDEACALADDGTATTFACVDVVIVAAGLDTTPKLTVALPYRNPIGAQLVDVDGDGRTDLVVGFAGSDGSGGGVVIVDDVDGAADVRVISTVPAHSVMAVNVDADPALELVAVTDAIHIYKLATTGPVDLQVLDRGPYTNAITSADLDGDGVRELIIGQSALSVIVLLPTTNTAGAP